MDWRKAAALTALAGVAAGPCRASAPVCFTGPEVVKMDWNTLALRIADIDGDGRNDLAMIDNDSGKIELLIQNNQGSARHKERRAVKRSRWEPVLEDASFWHDSVTMGGYGFDMVVGDFNGDARPDIAFTGSLTSLTIRFQSAEGTWDESWTYTNFKARQWGSTMEACDVDKDGKTDLVLMSDDELMVFRQGTQAMEEPRRYRLAAGPASRLLMSDVNGDGMPDALFMSGSDRFRRLSMRLQQSPGRFGPEIGFPLPTGSIGLTELDGAGKPFYATIDGLTRSILTFTIALDGEKPTTLATLQSRDTSTGTGKQGTLYAWGDFDGDGDIDIAFANPAKAEIQLMRQNGSGDFDEPVSFPSYSKISSLCTFSLPGRPDRLVVTSSGEEIAGIVSYSEGRMGFPEVLPGTGKAVSAATGRFTGDTASICLLEKRDSDTHLSIILADGTGWKPGPTLQVPGTKRKPDAISAAPILPDGRDAILVFASKDPVRIFTTGTESIVETAAESPTRSSCLSGMDPGRIGFRDLDGDGVCEMLAGAPGYVRALRLKADGTLEVAEQYNSTNPDADIRGPIFARLGGRENLVFYDDATDRLELLAQDGSDKVFRTAETFDWPSQSGIDSMAAVDLLGRAGMSILAMSEDRVSVMPLSAPSWRRRQQFPAYETDLDDIHYTQMESGDLSGDGCEEIVAADGNGNLLEILQQSEPGKPFASVMHFVVFEANPHAGGRNDGGLQPREMLIGDLNHDGRHDLALLIHDRVLIYLGAPAPSNVRTATAPAAKSK